jgi:hypothetical protein
MNEIRHLIDRNGRAGMFGGSRISIRRSVNIVNFRAETADLVSE